MSHRVVISQTFPAQREIHRRRLDISFLSDRRCKLTDEHDRRAVDRDSGSERADKQRGGKEDERYFARA